MTGPIHNAYLKLKKGSHNSKDTKNSIASAEKEEIVIFYEDLKVVEPIKKEKIPKCIPAHNTQLFNMENFKANGTHDQFKSYMVTHGNEQDASLYPDHTSPNDLPCSGSVQQAVRCREA